MEHFGSHIGIIYGLHPIGPHGEKWGGAAPFLRIDHPVESTPAPLVTLSIGEYAVQ